MRTEGSMPMVAKHETCEDCQSKGMVDGVRCETCGGRGWVSVPPEATPEVDATPEEAPKPTYQEARDAGYTPEAAAQLAGLPAPPNPDPTTTTSPATSPKGETDPRADGSSDPSSSSASPSSPTRRDEEPPTAAPTAETPAKKPARARASRSRAKAKA
jgi:hypothetical protein